MLGPTQIVFLIYCLRLEMCTKHLWKCRKKCLEGGSRGVLRTSRRLRCPCLKRPPQHNPGSTTVARIWVVWRCRKCSAVCGYIASFTWLYAVPGRRLPACIAPYLGLCRRGNWLCFWQLGGLMRTVAHSDRYLPTLPSYLRQGIINGQFKAQLKTFLFDINLPWRILVGYLLAYLNTFTLTCSHKY